MAMQIIRSDENYATLVAAAAQSGALIETLVQEALSERFPIPAPTKQKGDKPPEIYMLYWRKKNGGKLYANRNTGRS